MGKAKAVLVPKTDGLRPLQTRHNTASSSSSDLLVGLGWNPLKGSEHPFDGDLLILQLDAEGQVIQNGVTYYGRPVSDDGSCYVGNDNQDGEGPGDDEIAGVCRELAARRKEVRRIVVVANAYQAKKRQQNFGMVDGGFIRVTSRDGSELAHKSLKSFADDHDAIVACELRRDASKPDGWALDLNMQGVDFHELMDEFGVEIQY